MRFVSNSSNLNLGNFRDAKEAIEPAREVVINGVRRATTPEAYVVRGAVPIQFGQMGLTTADIDYAKQHLTWSGLPTEGDGVTPIDPAEFGRIGVWDSIEFQAQYDLTDEEREQAEQMVLTSYHHGREYIQLDEALVDGPAAPWHTYDSTHHSKIATIAEELRCVAEALAYERANKNRPSVVSALEERVGTTEPAQTQAAEPAEEMVIA